MFDIFLNNSPVYVGKTAEVTLPFQKKQKKVIQSISYTSQ